MMLTLFLAFAFIVFSTGVLPGAMRTTPNHFQEDNSNYIIFGTSKYWPEAQLLMGPALSKCTGDKIRLLVLIRIPSIVIFFCILTPLISSLWVLLPSVIQYYTGRFIRTIERRASLFPLPFPVVVLIQ